ncbi:DMT family transporter [Methylosoma difficile]
MPKHAPEQRYLLIGFLLVLLGALGFAAKAILIKLAYAVSPDVDALALISLRMLFSLPFFLLASVWHNRKQSKEESSLTAKQWFLVGLLGLMGYYFASYLDFLGLQYISAGLERMILFLYPTFVAVFSALFNKRAINSRTLIALSLSYAGMALVFIEHLSWETDAVWLGSGLVLGSSVIFAFFVMGSAMMTRTMGSGRFTAYSMSIACVVTISHFVAARGIEFWHLPVEVYRLAFIMAVFSTVLPSFFLNAGIRRIGAGSASIVSTTGPIITLVLAHFLLDEAITQTQLLGTALVLIGVYVVSRAKA